MKQVKVSASSASTMNSRLFVFALVALLSGCATNNFTKFYRDQTAGVSPAVLNENLKPFSGTTQVFSSNDLQRDGKDLMRRGYLVLGESAFEAGGNNTDAQLKEQAKLVGADLVLYATKFERSEQSYVPLVQYNPGQTSTTYSSGTANANVYGSNGVSAYGTANSSGYSTTTSPGTFSTQVVPITVQRYAYNAIYWRQEKPRVLGVQTDNLPDEMRMALKRNTGAIIKMVINDSPAFRANLLPGDVLIKIDDTSIDSSEDFTQKVPTFAGKECVLTVLRDGKETKLPVKLNPRS